MILQEKAHKPFIQSPLLADLSLLNTLSHMIKFTDGAAVDSV